MNKNNISYLLILSSLLLYSCRNIGFDQASVRPLVDTIGFAQYAWQMDSLMTGIEQLSPNEQYPDNQEYQPWKVSVSPHDDYTYVGSLYPEILRHIHAKTLLLVGVAHKAKALNLENRIVFDSHAFWKGPYGHVPVSAMREEILQNLDASIYEVNDSMHRIEHSLEALIPFLQYFNHQVEIIPVLVPYMRFTRIDSIAKPLSDVLFSALTKKKLRWGEDFAIIITTDAVHYGDEEWGGQNHAPFGCDSAGNARAVEHEFEIIKTSLEGEVSKERIQKFSEFTIQESDYREYKWTWCGRYSVPLGLLTAYYLQDHLSRHDPLEGILVGYSTSIDHQHLCVDDLMMGRTAVANPHHWVGYAAIGYH
jgi:AmmeMemoRadiSam system protein B